MNRVALPVLALIGVAIVYLLMPNVGDSITEFRTDVKTESFVVATGAGVTTSDITLTQSLWNANTASVSELTSSNAADTPRASSYASGTKALTILGLNQSLTRNITAVYRYGALDDYTGADRIGTITPLIIMAALVIFAIGAAIKIFM